MNRTLVIGWFKDMKRWDNTIRSIHFLDELLKQVNDLAYQESEHELNSTKLMDWVDNYSKAYNNPDIGPVDVNTAATIESFFEKVEFGHFETGDETNPEIIELSPFKVLEHEDYGYYMGREAIMSWSHGEYVEFDRQSSYYEQHEDAEAELYSRLGSDKVGTAERP
ncbi:hypothetical protein [Paenibacillus sp. IHB B 3084]|uniref:hypothetical protein n=1 Tax=Paenibacillus sp. IHB B 3084 TaxID=867076 RepID=UPI0010719CC2|nr:hypothetical protein [Paenibacillus sp. IHB B 3084]